jgi:hypothetical protein
MSNNGEQGPPQRWNGQAVEDKPGAEAELAADRAEGNSRIPVAEERERIEEPPAPEQEPMRLNNRPRHTDDPEEEIAETAEEHQERDAVERPPRGKL